VVDNRSEAQGQDMRYLTPDLIADTLTLMPVNPMPRTLMADLALSMRLPAGRSATSARGIGSG